MEIFFDYYQSPLGLLKLNANKEAIVSIDFVEDKIAINSNKILKETKRQLDKYFVGKLFNFHLPLAPIGTDFQTKVWKELIKVSYGDTASYIEISNKVGHENAQRAIGGANNSNPIPIIIPCHRIIGKNGCLKGYSSGVWRKKWLIDFEYINQNKNKKSTAVFSKLNKSMFSSISPFHLHKELRIID